MTWGEVLDYVVAAIGAIGLPALLWAMYTDTRIKGYWKG